MRNTAYSLVRKLMRNNAMEEWKSRPAEIPLLQKRAMEGVEIIWAKERQLLLYFSADLRCLAVASYFYQTLSS